MNSIPEIRTERLLLRPWRDADCAPFAALNADPRVMEFMPHMLSRELSDAMAGRIRSHFDKHGYGLWAVALADIEFIGFIGLQWAGFESHFTPALEVGFRLMAEHWGKGYASEGGRAVVAWAFENTDLPAIHSWTAEVNHRSISAIGKVGLKKIGEFDHPRVPEGNPLRHHHLFRVTREAWANS